MPSLQVARLPTLQAGTVGKVWALFYSLSSGLVAQSVKLERQHRKALMYYQQALVVQRAAQLQSSDSCAHMLAEMLENCICLAKNPATPSFPFEGFVDAVVQATRVRVSPQQYDKLLQVEKYVQEHQRWVEELQQELVR